MTTKKIHINPLRRLLTVTALLVALLLLVGRSVDLQVTDKDFLQSEGDTRYLRVVSIPVHRGAIYDRRGELLAISTPVDSVWVDPRKYFINSDQREQLSRLLQLNEIPRMRSAAGDGERRFVYLKRHIDPDMGRRVMSLAIPGLYLQREYRRYYPAGGVAGHLVGFTNIDDQGQEGLELAYDTWLQGTAGSKRVMRDRLGRTVEDVERISEPSPGRDLHLSIDRRIQYLAYRALKTAVQRHEAHSGSAVVLDVRSGEVLAMVNQPAFNPNNRTELYGHLYRNRALTDVFEPGSTIKPFIIATALASGRYRPGTIIDTSPGLLRVGNATVRDVRNFGRIDLTTVMQKSSNVGASKIALTLDRESIWNTLSSIGFGAQSGSGFPGESRGVLTGFSRWRDIELATLSYGYGLSVTTLQLARAYAALAGGGILPPVSFLRVDDLAQVGARAQRVFSPEVAGQIRRMLERVVGEGGTGTAAVVPGYRVAGKTGTVKQSGIGGYLYKRYNAIFAGFVPAVHPRLVMAVVINEPTKGGYYGGVIAAPVFAEVMSGALHLLDVAPDHLVAPDHPVEPDHPVAPDHPEFPKHEATHLVRLEAP